MDSRQFFSVSTLRRLSPLNGFLRIFELVRKSLSTKAKRIFNQITLVNITPLRSCTLLSTSVDSQSNRHVSVT